MDFIAQKASLEQLTQLAAVRKQSVLVEGIEGTGKSYLAKQYSKLLDIPDFQIVEPKVQLIKEMIAECTALGSEIVICVENLDLGVVGAAYAILKFLEEPIKNVFIVITCRNIKYIPDTIISRSAMVTVPPPTTIDLVNYGLKKNDISYQLYKDKPIWKCVKTFNDVDTVLDLTNTDIAYFEELPKVLSGKDPIGNLIWTLQKYPDGRPTPLELVIRYIICISKSISIHTSGYSCLQDLSKGRISSHVVLAKFLFEYKYAS